MKAHFEEQDRELLKEKIKFSKYPVKILKDGQAFLAGDDNYKLVGREEEVKIS